MKKLVYLLLAIVLLCAACGGQPESPDTTAPAPQQTTAPTTLPADTTVPDTEPVTEPPTEPATEPVTEPEHSSLYIPGLEVEDVILYFNEVVLDAEFVSSGDPSRLQKWAVPIVYSLHGAPTEEDLTTLTGFVQWLNTIEGFPGIQEAGESWEANLAIHFCEQDRMVELLGDQFDYMDGGVVFWYDYDMIYDATICYRIDLDQYVRNSVILEEIYNGLGPVQDTSLREDSLIYSGYSTPQELTEIDELILKLLYHPDMVCGMNAEECEAVIRQLYY